MIIEKELQKIYLTMFNGEKEVFSGELNDLPEFMEQKKTADRVKLYNADGSAVALMRYQDLEMLIAGNKEH